MSGEQPPGDPNFDVAFRDRFLELLNWRRDVREFLKTPLPPGLFEHLVHIACLAPSVGLSQPWRFVLFADEGRRRAVRESFSLCNSSALRREHGERAMLYARLKLAGLEQAPVQFALFADMKTEQGHQLGRRTMPETLHYSTVTAVHTLWLAARIEGLGLGWVSILDPEEVTSVADVPADWGFVGYFCLGYPAAANDTPALQLAGWEHRHNPEDFILRR